MNEYKCSGEYKNKAGEWAPLTVTIKASNEMVARVRATEWLHKITSVKKVA